jgi:hypothetical protein
MVDDYIAAHGPEEYYRHTGQPRPLALTATGHLPGPGSQEEAEVLRLTADYGDRIAGFDPGEVAFAQAVAADPALDRADARAVDLIERNPALAQFFKRDLVALASPDEDTAALAWYDRDTDVDLASTYDEAVQRAHHGNEIERLSMMADEQQAGDARRAAKVSARSRPGLQRPGGRHHRSNCPPDCTVIHPPPRSGRAGQPVKGGVPIAPHGIHPSQVGADKPYGALHSYRRPMSAAALETARAGHT